MSKGSGIGPGSGAGGTQRTSGEAGVELRRGDERRGAARRAVAPDGEEAGRRAVELRAEAFRVAGFGVDAVFLAVLAARFAVRFVVRFVVRFAPVAARRLVLAARRFVDEAPAAPREAASWASF